MTKEETAAKELIDKFRHFEYDDGTSVVIHRNPFMAAKYCSLICINEMLSVLEEIYTPDSRKLAEWRKIKEAIQKA